MNVAKPLRRDKMNNLARRKPSSRTSTTASTASNDKCMQCITTSATKMSRFNAPSPKQMTIFDASSTEYQERVHVLQALQVLRIVMPLLNKIFTQVLQDAMMPPWLKMESLQTMYLPHGTPQRQAMMVISLQGHKQGKKHTVITQGHS